MGKILRWPIRTYVYSAIFLYFTALCIGKGIEFVWFVLSESAAISHTSAEAVTSAPGPWDFLCLNEEIAAFRMWALAIVTPIAKAVAGALPPAGAAMREYPLISLGLIALAAAGGAFVAGDLLTGLYRRVTKSGDVSQ